MSIAYESEPRHEVIDMNAERTRLRTELSDSLEPVALLPVTYEIDAPISQEEIDAFRAKDAEIAQRHADTREVLAAAESAVTRLHERDVAEVSENKTEAEMQFQMLKRAHELDFQRRVRAAEETMYREIQKDAYNLDVRNSLNDTKLHASETLIQATQAAIHQTETAVEGGSTVRQQHIENREALTTYLNQLTDRYNDRARQISEAQGRILVLNKGIDEDEKEKEHLHRAGKKLRALDTKIRTAMADRDPDMIRLRTQMGVNEESENIKEIIDNIRDRQTSADLVRIEGDLDNNAEAIRVTSRSIQAQENAREGDELIIENAAAELSTLSKLLDEAREKYAYEVEVVAPQLEKQSISVLGRTATIKTYVDGTTNYLAHQDSYAILKPLEQAVRDHQAASALGTENYVADASRPASYKPDEVLPYIEPFDVQDELAYGERRLETVDGIAPTLKAIESSDIIKSTMNFADIARKGVMKTGRRLMFRSNAPAEE